MANHLTPFEAGWRSVARPLCATAALALLLSCGGGGGDGPNPPPPETGVFTGFNGDLNWEVASGGVDGGVGGAADGDGGVGGGGDFGQFRNAMVVVKFPDGTPLGQAPTDPNTGMVTIKPGKTYQGPLYVELQGGPNASYFEEGKGDFVPFPAGTVIRVWVPKITKNIGITAFTDAGYRLLTEGSTPERATGTPTAAQIGAANDKIRDVLNQQFPNTLHVDDITRLPFIKSPSIGPGSISIDPRGRYGLVNGAFSKQAAMFNANEPTPTLAALKHFGEDMLDGKLDGSNGAQPAAPADKRTYDPHTLTGELSSALAEQSFRFGDDKSKLALPKLLNFGNTRYEGYLFDASLRADGKAFDTVAGWVTDNSKNRNLGDSFDKLPDVNRTFAVFANHGHGSVFFKAINPVGEKDNSQSKIFAVGDNVNGELGIGTNTSTGGKAVEVQMPAGLTLTHISGGFAHTVARFADGSVYAWGDNSYGQLGQGMDANALPRSLTPVKVNLPAGAAAVAATSTAAYALLADGRVYSWGSNGGFGLLGDGDKNGERTQPGPVLTAGGSLSDVVQIAARDNDAIVVRRDGSVLTWGSYPADADGGFTEHELGAPYRGGTPLPAAVAGFPQGLEIRKILTEQGLFAALASDGAVYTWGVYFDLTAKEVLRDLVPVRVLGLPPVRDMMPGGFIGYGERPFDRLTSTAIDDRGGMWKVRGRVAEQFDPDNPAQQRRPKSAVARRDCASCHLVLTDWPLTPPAPTSGNVCVPPSEFHGNIADPATSLIHADTKCEQCHNPARAIPRPSFTEGWLNCIRPDNLPPRPQLVTPPTDTESCAAPAGHVFTPPGTTCSSCHNSVIARPLQQIPGPTSGKVCGQPPSSALPSIRTTATITSAVNDAGGSIPAGTSTRDTTPTLQGTLSAPLIAGQSVALLRNGEPIGTVTPSGTSWSLTDPAAPGGSQPYSARVVAGTAIGPTSATFTILIDTLAPVQTANITGISDDSGPLANGASTVDNTPTVSGALSAALGTGESLQVLRSIAGAPAGTPPFVINVVPTGLAFTFPDSALSSATYVYQARIVDTAGNEGPLGASRSVTISTSFAAPTITLVNGSTPAGGAVAPTTNRSFAVAGTYPGALPSGTAIRVYQRTGTTGGFTPLAGSAGVTPGTSTNWSYPVPGPLADQVHAFFARVESISTPPLIGAQSQTVSIIVDTTVAATPVSLRATSDVLPFNNLFGADRNSFLDQGPEPTVTNDLRPRLVVTLRDPLAADATRATESLILVRGTTEIELPSGSILATACPPNSGATTFCFSDETATALSLAPPLSPPGTASSVGYEVFVRDKAGNESKRIPLASSFDYATCTQAQADGGDGRPHGGGDITSSATNCNRCHNTAEKRGATFDAPNFDLPKAYGINASIFVAVPPSGAYWCKRPQNVR